MEDYIVTGASSGIGYATALALTVKGHRVFALARQKQSLEKLAAEAGKNGGTVVPVVMDLSDGNYTILEEALNKANVSHLTGVLHNAGALINKPFDKLELTDWQKVYGVNVFGVAMLTRFLLGRMGGVRNTHIVMISSIGGMGATVKYPGLSAYSSSKGAVLIMAECLAEEFRDRNIQVNCLALGSVQTEMLSAAFPGYKAPLLPGEIAEFISGFCEWGWKFFNGKVVPVSLTNP
ncbi:MAG TPA: SDR family oxidoreductase [Bacteroidia bacterium]|nr:SDR family oxidoreductase [Bacteroidia bacterium]